MRKYICILALYFSYASPGLAFQCERPSTDKELNSYVMVFWGEVIAGPLSSLQFRTLFAEGGEGKGDRFSDWIRYKEAAGNTYTLEVKRPYKGPLRRNDLVVVRLADLSEFLEEKHYLIFANTASNKVDIRSCDAVPLVNKGLEYVKGAQTINLHQLRMYNLLPGYRSLE